LVTGNVKNPKAMYDIWAYPVGGQRKNLKTIVHAQRLKYSAQRRARAETFEALHIP
jgi:hypothetical protein